MRTIVLAAVLGIFWAALSGYSKTFLVTMGVVSVLACLIMASRMRSIDEEGVPIQLATGAITYFPWLLWEIVKSAWSVAQIIIHPRLPISPTMTEVDATQRTDVGINVYANSITLTPGTLTTSVDGKRLTIHAIVRDGADDLEAGGMDRRVTRFEGGV